MIRRREEGAIRLLRPDGPPLAARLLRAGSARAWRQGDRLLEAGLLREGGDLLLLDGIIDWRERPDGLWLARRRGGEVELWRQDEAALRPVRALRASGLHLGPGWLLAWRGAEAWTEGLEPTDAAPALPLGALQARAQPWPVGEGASWADGRAVLRWTPAGIALVEVAAAPIRALRPGPLGALVLHDGERLLVRAPGGGLRDIGRRPPARLGASFDPSGERALVDHAEGVAQVALRTGEIEHDLEGARAAGWRQVEQADGRRRPLVGEARPAPPPPRGARIPWPSWLSPLPAPGGELRVDEDGGLVLGLAADTWVRIEPPPTT